MADAAGVAPAGGSPLAPAPATGTAVRMNTTGSSYDHLLPAAFPKKRRGRPPGRPNMTVREADYEQNELVKKWNTAKSARAISVVCVHIRDALDESVLIHESQRAVFQMPSREIIYFVQGWITARHIASQRPSYINGILIHSRGSDSPLACSSCVDRRAKNALGPFPSCRQLLGRFHNSCSNCKWFDNTSTCSLYTGPAPNRKRKAKEIAATPTMANGASGEGPVAPPPPQPEHLNHHDYSQYQAQQQQSSAGHAEQSTSLSEGEDEEEGDASSVDAQLTAQLLPEINGPD
ncbi:hypothetical protein B0H66DRAFT_576946 [Apodospora peruviana]|uniref:Uncharacterized protein n=1 Tax=Apodospora peruviana TaxID=516989 RepID=A0AAE0HXW3_9PEZI|nr:hypothetical protein B0H66DRAFT_576946 [Apodospora peruviana]